jgi:hypothetical protein
MPNWQNGHAGIVSFPSGAANSVNELVANQGSDLGGPVFANVQKCMVRWVVLCNGLYSSSSFDGEWHVGLGNPDGFGAMYGGALLSFAPGYPAAGLLAGLYTSISNYTETPTSFTIAPNTWYDLIISWTPEAIKYYAAVYGSPPNSRMLCPSTSLIQPSLHSGDATASTGCSLCMRNGFTSGRGIPVSALCCKGGLISYPIRP